MTSWLADDPELERRIPRMEQRGHRIGLIAVELAFAPAIVGIWTWALSAWPAFDYWVVPSLLPTYGVGGLGVLVALWLVVRQRKRAQVATWIVGLTVVVMGVVLGLAPPVTTFPGFANDRQSGWCRSVFANVGLHGDDREDCFDARGARANDVAIILTLGVLISAAGCATLESEHDRTLSRGV